MLQKLRLEKELHDGRSKRTALQIKKIQSCCNHSWKVSSSKRMEYDFGVVYSAVTKECTVCKATISQNIFH